MKGSGGGGAVAIIAIIVIIAIVSILLSSGLIKTSIPSPTAQLSITPSSISVQNGQTSSTGNPITIHLTNVQNANNTVFNIVLNSSNIVQVKPKYFNGTTVTTINTGPLIGVEPYTSPPILVSGELPSGVTSSVSYSINVTLYYKNTLLDKKTIQVTVT